MNRPGTAGDSLPAYCGDIGVQRFQNRPIPDAFAVAEPPILLERGRDILVTNTRDTIVGDVSSVAHLIAHPAPDGIALREAVTATNNDPGPTTIRFAPTLKGATIKVKDDIGLLTGNIVIDGDIDGDGQPDITLDDGGGASAVQIESSGNLITGLAIQNATTGVGISCFQCAKQTSSGNIVRNLTILNVQTGVAVGAGAVPGLQFTDLLIAGNTMTVSSAAVALSVGLKLAGNAIERVTIRDNVIHVAAAARISGAVEVLDGWGIGGDSNTVSDLVIADNTVDGALAADSNVFHFSIGGAAKHNRVQRVRISGNQVNVAATQPFVNYVNVAAGDGASDDKDSPSGDQALRPIVYPDDNSAAGIWIAGNTFSGLTGALSFETGIEGGTHSVISNVFILGNQIRTSGRQGINLLAASTAHLPAEDQVSTGDVIENIVIQGNSIQLAPAPFQDDSGAIVVWGAEGYGTNNQARNLWISHNYLDGGGELGIELFGASADPSGIPPYPTGNSVSGVEGWCNVVQAITPDPFDQSLSIKGINLLGGMSLASGNTVDSVRLLDNLVGGVENDVSVISNGYGASGNTAQLAPPPDPSTPEIHPALLNLGSVRNDPIAAGSIVTLYGWGLAPGTGSAAAIPLPDQLAQTQVMIDGIAAPLFYVSPGQINFQVPWEVVGPVSFVSVLRNAAALPPQPLTVTTLGPGILTADGSGAGQGAILIAGTTSLAAPPSLYPGSQPAHPGDFIAIYATGLGAVSNQPPTGSPASTVTSTSAAPTVSIGGANAAVAFSGLAPGIVGLYQLNVQVPINASIGDTVPLTISFGNLQSNTATIAVRQP